MQKSQLKKKRGSIPQGKWKLGTRGSLLAIAQSSWVKSKIQEHYPHLEVELEIIRTRGDEIQHLPLQKLEGKDFFVQELDHALINEKVDLCVHSLKDLSVERPLELQWAAIPKRENPRDVVLFHPDVMNRIQKGLPVRVGTSSPRRLENIPSFLEWALPAVEGKNPKIEFVEIRGNVNTRLSRVLLSDHEEKKLDAVVLAFAGLIRLQEAPSSKEEIQNLLLNLKWMILPLSESPAAPGQGALCVEVRKQGEWKEWLSFLHDEETKFCVEKERDFLKEEGGGCHQRFGVTVFKKQGKIKQWIRGKRKDGSEVCVHTKKPKQEVLKSRDLLSRWGVVKKNKIIKEMKFEKKIYFIAHEDAVPVSMENLESPTVLCSGVHSWRKLAQKGFWVSACGESLGVEWLRRQVLHSSLPFYNTKEWTVLTHEKEKNFWVGQGYEAKATYRVEYEELSEDQKKECSQVQQIYWSSAYDYQFLKPYLSKSVVHFCGEGKTKDKLLRLGVEIDESKN